MSSDSPTVSVVTPTHDDGRTLPLALASLVAQTYDDWECIVVDDGSRDEPRPAELLDDFTDPRLRLIEFDENRGRSRARQAGLDAARGDFLCMLDADDWYLPAKLDHQLAVADEFPDCALVATDTYIASHRGELSALGRTRPEPLREFPDRDPPLSLHEWTDWGRPPLSHGTAMIRIETARRATYDPHLTRTEDMDFLLQCALGERFAILRTPLYVYTNPAPDHRRTRMFESLRNELRICLKHADAHPIPTARLTTELLAKIAAYHTIFALDIDPLTLRSQHEPPTPRHHDRFRETRTLLDAHFP